MQIHLPLLVDIAEDSGGITLTKTSGWFKSGEGFVFDGYNSRLSTTTIPSEFQSATAAVGFQVSARSGTYYNNSTNNVVCSLCSTTGVAKAELALGADPANTTVSAFRFRTVTSGGTQTKILGRPGWQFMGRTHATIAESIQGVHVLDETYVLYSVHFANTKSRIYKVRRDTWEVVGYFDFSTVNLHIANIDYHADYGLWMADYTTGTIFQVDLDASLVSGTGVKLKTWTVFDGLSGVCFADVNGSTYMVLGKYATTQQYAVVIDPSVITDGGTYVEATHKIKKFLPRAYAQGITVIGNKMYVSSNGSGYEGFIDELDFATFMASGTDGANYTTMGFKQFVGPTGMPEDLSHDENGYLWCASEGFTTTSTVEGQACWRFSPTEVLQNIYTFNFDGSAWNLYQNGKIHYSNLALVPNTVPTALSIGGLITGTPSSSGNGFGISTINCVHIQDSVIDIADVASIASGSTETSSLSEHELVIVNPGAELGTISGWTNDVGAVGVLDSSTRNPWDGSYYFYGGAVVSSTAHQRLDLLAAGITATDLDAGKLGFLLRWRQSSYDGLNDPGYMGISFLDSTQTQISQVLAGQIYTNLPLAWNRREVGAVIPTGTRYVDLIMHMARTSGTNNDTYIDAIQAFISSPGIPALLALFGWHDLTKADDTTAWSVLNRAAAETIWHVLTRVTATFGWKLCQLSTAIMAWMVSVSKLQQLSWHELTRNSSSVVWRDFTRKVSYLSWHDLTKNLATIAWSLLSRRSVNTSWRVFIGKTKQLSWHVLTRKISACSWHVFIRKSTSIVWNICASIVKQLSWKVLVKLGSYSSWSILAKLYGIIGWKDGYTDVEPLGPEVIILSSKIVPTLTLRSHISE